MPQSTDWTLNKTGLEKGMLIRRPGLRESLEVLAVKSGQAKIKLPDGKSTTITAAAEVQYRWPEGYGKSGETGEPKQARKPEPKPSADLALLPGMLINLPDHADVFRVLRVGEVQARIKNERNAQIISIPVGHDFTLVAMPEGKSESKPESQARKKPKSEPKYEPESEIENEEPPFETGEEEGEEIEIDSDDEVPEEVQAEIDEELNGDEEDEEIEDDEEQEEETEPEDESDDDIDLDSDSNTRKEPSMPSEWLTVHELASKTELSAARINSLRRDGAIGKKSWKTDPEDTRRILYHRSLVTTLSEMPKRKRGRAPKAAASDRSTSSDEKQASKPERKPRTELIAKDDQEKEPTASNRRQMSIQPTSLQAALATAIEQAQNQIGYLHDLVVELEKQQERLRLWS